MKISTDIDIDFADRDEALSELMYISASKITNDKITKHNVGVYFQNIPSDPFTNLSTIDYQEAENRGYFKIDFLNLSVYKDVRNEEHLIELMNTEPMWELLENEEFVNQLFQLNGNFSIVEKLKPKSIDQLAMTIAMIRPAKRHLINKSWEDIEKTIWDLSDSDETYGFKKSHSLSYAMVIVVQMNLIVETLMKSDLNFLN